MRELTRAGRRLQDAAYRFEPRGWPLSLARTVSAAATLTVILCTPDGALFAYTNADPDGVRCGGISALSLWCVAGSTGWVLVLDRTLAVAVLAAAAAGWRPRWTCLPHWYVTYSLAVGMTLPNGGETVAQILTLLLVPICLADDRRWQWSAPAGPLPPSWRGAAWAATLTLRLQAGLVYGVAGLSKLLVPQWRDGTAMYAVFHDPGYGLPAELLPRVSPLVDSGVVVSALTWAVPVLEIAIAVAVLGTRRSRGAAVLIGGMLHLGIICALGLFSFGLIMIALLLATWLPTSRDSTWSRPTTAHSPTTAGSGPL
jgi:antimicrobial peptide system SdpB family protein